MHLSLTGDPGAIMDSEVSIEATIRAMPVRPLAVFQLPTSQHDNGGWWTATAGHHDHPDKLGSLVLDTYLTGCVESEGPRTARRWRSARP